MPPSVSPPRSETELRTRARALAGMSIEELASWNQVELPQRLTGHKGLIGECLEFILGADAASRPLPDFSELGIELKTLPLNAHQRPKESTYVCRLNVNALPSETWATSSVKRKLDRVLWFPVEANPAVPLKQRRLGVPRIWSPSPADLTVLEDDWNELTDLAATGRFDQIDGRLGTFLQLRAKAPHSRALTSANNSEGRSAPTLPRGFYLRTIFTARILERGEIA